MFAFKNVDFVMFRRKAKIQRQKQLSWERILTASESVECTRLENPNSSPNRSKQRFHSFSQISRRYTLQGKCCQNFETDYRLLCFQQWRFFDFDNRLPTLTMALATWYVCFCLLFVYSSLWIRVLCGVTFLVVLESLRLLRNWLSGYIVDTVVFFTIRKTELRSRSFDMIPYYICYSLLW